MRTCEDIDPTGTFVCELPAGHDGQHIAHGANGNSTARWPVPGYDSGED
jgi:hypothetical protein